MTALSFVFGTVASPVVALAQGGFDGGSVPPPGADPEEVVELCVAGADARFEERTENAESSLRICVGVTGVANAVAIAACIILSGGTGTLICVGGGAAAEAGALVLCGDNFASASMEAELQRQFEVDTCEMLGAMGGR